MRRTTKRFLCGALAAALVACSTSTPPPVATFNDRAGQATRTVTFIRQAATDLLIAGKISVEQDRTIQGECDLAIEAVKSAQAIRSRDPILATAQLSAALETVDALKRRTGVK